MEDLSDLHISVQLTSAEGKTSGLLQFSDVFPNQCSGNLTLKKIKIKIKNTNCFEHLSPSKGSLVEIDFMRSSNIRFYEIYSSYATCKSNFKNYYFILCKTVTEKQQLATF